MDKKKNQQMSGKIVVATVLVILLGAAAFIGGTLFSQAESNSTEDNDLLVSFLADAEGIPEELPELVGTLAERDGNSLFLATANTTGVFGPAHGAVANGPIVEVVVNRDTLMLADVSALDFTRGGGGTGGGGDHSGPGIFANLDRVIEPGELEEININDNIFVWGERTGDRITAITILYLVIPPTIHGG